MPRAPKGRLRAVPWRGALLAAAAVGVLAAAASLCRLDWSKQLRLRADGMPAEGRVTALNHKDRRRVAYDFSVGGRAYSGVGVAGRGNPEFADLAPGDRVLVVYLPADPSVSTLGDPAEHLRPQNAALLLLVLGGLAAAGALVAREQSRFRS